MLRLEKLTGCICAAMVGLLLQMLPASAQTNARDRRHLRRGPIRTTVAAVQCALRRVRFSADRHVRWRGRFACTQSAPTGKSRSRCADSHYCGPEVWTGVRPMISIISWAARRPQLGCFAGTRFFSSTWENSSSVRLPPAIRADT
jgi:hypothetical protein